MRTKEGVRGQSPLEWAVSSLCIGERKGQCQGTRRRGSGILVCCRSGQGSDKVSAVKAPDPETLACTPRPLDHDGFNSAVVMPYGLTTAHIAEL